MHHCVIYIYIYEKCKIIIKTSLLTMASSQLPVARLHPGQTPASCVSRAAHLARMCEPPCPAGHPTRVLLA